MRQQELATRQRELARLCPAVVSMCTKGAKFYTRVIDPIFLDLVRQPQTQFTARLSTLRRPLDVLPQLPYTFQKRYHGIVEISVEEPDAQG